MTGRASPAPGADLAEDAPLGAMIEQEVLRAGLHRVLRAVRRHLGMDVAFIARFGDTDRVFEYVDADSGAPIAAGQSLSLQEGYCQKVVSGELPQCIPDTTVLAAARRIPATLAVPIGAHLSVPISLESGAVYGTLCCFSYLPNPDLSPRDMRLMHAFAEVLAARIDEALATGARSRGLHEEVRRALEDGAPRMVFQPIYRVGGGRPGVTGVEALARFDVEPLRGPDRWFETAEAVGLRHDLELAAIAHALPALERLPRALFLALNVSPGLILSGRLGPALAGAPGERLMLEVTEHATIADYAALEAALCPLRARGIRLAVDDAGAGFASMRHILNLAPDMIKLDLSLTRGIDGDPRRRALARGLLAFAHDIGCAIAAEGVETQAELDTLRGLGVDEAQGYLLDPPLGLDEVLRRRPAASAA